MYAIHAAIAYRQTDNAGTTWTGTVHLPTFYLNENVQGILDEHGAENVASDILDPFSTYGDDLVITASKV